MHTTGAIVTLDTEVKMLLMQLERWGAGNMPTGTAATLIRRTARRIDTTCWCGQGVCCVTHNLHVGPHQNCILR